MSLYTATNLPSDGETIDAADVNTDLQGMIDEFNGSIDNDNIAASADIALSKLASGAWTAYTPTWTPAGGAATMGNSVSTGAYMQIGKTVHFWAQFIIGTTGDFTGLTSMTVSLPKTASASFDTLTEVMEITGIIYSGAVSWFASAIGNTSTTIRIVVIATSAAYATNADIMAAVPPAAWATGSICRIAGTYEAA